MPNVPSPSMAVATCIAAVLCWTALAAPGRPARAAGAAPTADMGGMSAGGASPEAAYLAQNDTAMAKMMAGMSVRPTGDVDHDFEAAMVAHHQGAIDMAVAELSFGHNEALRRIAQGIVVEQQQEIAAMQLAVQPPAPSAATGKTR